MRVDRLAQRQCRLVDIVILTARQRDFDTAAAASTEAQRAAPAYIRARSGNIVEWPRKFVDDFGLTAVALAPVGELRVNAHAVGIVSAHDGKGAAHLAAVEIGRDDRFDLIELLVHEVEPDPVRAGGIDGDDAAVLVGHQFAVELREQQASQARQQNRTDDDQLPPVEAPGQPRGIPVLQFAAPARQTSVVAVRRG